MIEPCLCRRTRVSTLIKTLQVLLLVTCILFFVPQNNPAQIPALTGPTSVAGIFVGLKSAISQLEQAASRLMDQGDIIAARQLGLVAQVLRVPFPSYRLH